MATQGNMTASSMTETGASLGVLGVGGGQDGPVEREVGVGGAGDGG